MLRDILLYLVSVLLVCEAATDPQQPQSYSVTGRKGLVRSTMEGVQEVRFRDVAVQYPIAPLAGGDGHQFGFPQRFSLLIEEVGQDGTVLRESVCYFGIEEPKNVLDEIFRCAILLRGNFRLVNLSDYHAPTDWKGSYRRAYLARSETTDMEQLFNIDSRLITAADSSMQNLRRVRGNDRLEEYFSFDVIINKFVSLNHMSLWFRPITDTRMKGFSNSITIRPDAFDYTSSVNGKFIRFIDRSIQNRESSDAATYATSIEWKNY